jgi:hypothetical protein
MVTSAAVRAPKLPTALVVGQTLSLFGKLVTVTVYDAASHKAVAVTEAGVEYVRSCYFVAHKNLWRSRWINPANF